MKRLLFFNFLVCIGLCLLSCVDSSERAIRTDICILGGSEAGFTAAIKAARLGKRVVLIEPTGHPGGMMVEGIVKDIRFGSGRVIGGIAREVYIAVEKYYGKTAEFDNPDWYSQYEPKVASQVIESMLAAEKNIVLVRSTRIKEQGGVEKKGTVLQKVILENGQTVSAKIFIDASIEGHLLHLAGVGSETIREGKDRYGESKNGIQHDNSYRNFEINIDPYNVPGDPNSGLIATIQEGELGDLGAADKYIQGFCFRLVLTNNQDNRIPIEKPDNYDPKAYEIYRRYLAAGGRLFKPQANRENQKTDLGSWHDLSANLYGQNYEYPDGDYKTQKRVVQYHRDFTQGLIWFLQNDPEVDSETRANWKDWGLSKDEFTDNDGWPRRLYIRSARRMVSDYVITQHHVDLSNPDRVEDPVAIAWWPPDTHHARRIVKDGYAYNEGFVFGGEDWRPFGVSWRSLTPKASECANLITPTCLSSSYVAYGAIRILPTFMILGESSGAAASIAIDTRKSVQEIDYGKLRNTLVEGGQILKIPDNWLEVITSTN